MNRLKLPLIIGAVLWTSCHATQDANERLNANAKESQDRDAAVLEVVLMDLLTQLDSPVEPRNKADKAIHFSAEALTHEIKSSEVLHIRDEEKLKKLPTDQLAKAREAAEHLTQRVAKKEVFRAFTPKDKRVMVHLSDVKEKESARLGRTQVFRAYPPGYSNDQEFAIVHLSFTWSGGFHGASGTYLMQKRKDVWSVLLKDIVFYP